MGPTSGMVVAWLCAAIGEKAILYHAVSSLALGARSEPMVSLGVFI